MVSNLLDMWPLQKVDAAPGHVSDAYELLAVTPKTRFSDGFMTFWGSRSTLLHLAYNTYDFYFSGM